MTLLARVVDALRSREIPHCLIGAAALAAHGVSRSTQDIDLLAADPAALSDMTWAELKNAGVSVDVRPGDSTDPLAGVVRLQSPEEDVVDVVVALAPWHRALIGRARAVRLEDLELPVAEAADIILLKLYAGGPQDMWDIQQLLGTARGHRIAADVDARLGDLPAEHRRLWDSIRGTRG